MTSASTIVKLNAAFTTAGAVGILLTRGLLPGLLGLSGPTLLDAIAVALLGYAALVAFVGSRHAIRPHALLALAAADAAWVIGSAIVLLLFWKEMAVAGRVLVLSAALVVEVFATLQFRAAHSAHA